MATAIGVALMAAPDTDERLFSISETHGPATLDAIGAALLISGWLMLTAATLVRWRRLRSLPSGRLVGGVTAYVVGAVITVFCVTQDLGLWWLPGAVMMAASQVAAALAVSR